MMALRTILRPKPLLAYAFAQGLWFAAFLLIPVGGWWHAIWQGLSGWASAAAVLVGVRRFRPQAPAAFYIIAAGMFLSASGTTVEMIEWRNFGVTTNPNAADLFWLSLHPCLVVGLGVLVYRRTAAEDVASTLLNTAACTLLNLFLGIFAWEFIVWRIQSDHSLSLANRIVVTIYPLADLLLIALTVRLLLAGGYRNATVVLIALALAGFLAADIGWSGFLRSGSMPDAIRQYLLEVTSLSARALLGAAALHPAIREVAHFGEGERPHLGLFGWVALAASALTAPLVLLLQALLDRFYSVTSF